VVSSESVEVVVIIAGGGLSSLEVVVTLGGSGGSVFVWPPSPPPFGGGGLKFGQIAITPCPWKNKPIKVDGVTLTPVQALLSSSLIDCTPLIHSNEHGLPSLKSLRRQPGIVAVYILIHASGNPRIGWKSLKDTADTAGSDEAYRRQDSVMSDNRMSIDSRKRTRELSR
jgi:hypothetical protein